MSYQKYSSEEKERICTLLNNGHVIQSLSSILSIPASNLYKWKSLFDNGISFESRHSPGRKKVEEAELIEKIDNNPELSNEDLSAVVDNKITPRSVTNYLKRQNPPFTRKAPLDEEPIDDNRALELGEKILTTLNGIKQSIRIYQDESYIYDNERPKRVRSRRDIPVYRKRKRRGKRYAFALSMTNQGLLHPPYLIKKNFNDTNFMEYVREELASVFQKGMVVIWDQLGKSGRKKNPTA